MKQVNIAVAGSGDIATIRYHYALERMKDKFRLVAIHDWDESVRERVSREWGVPAYDNLEELLALPELDTLIVTTYHPSHAGIAVKAMEAGKNVLIEKPFCTRSADAERIRETAERTGRLCMALPYETYPNFVEAKRLIDSGAIGRVCSCDGEFAHRGPLHAPWFFDREKAEWGVLADLGIYPLGILAYLLGPFHRVSGRVETLYPNRTSLAGEPIHATVEDNAVAILEWENGVLGTVRTNWCTAADKNGSIYSATVYGSDGIIYLNMLTHQLVVYSPNKPIEGGKRISYQGFQECYEIQVPEYDDHTDILETYHRALETGVIENDEGMLERQINIVRMIEKLYESSDTGNMVLV